MRWDLDDDDDDYIKGMESPTDSFIVVVFFGQECIDRLMSRLTTVDQLVENHTKRPHVLLAIVDHNALAWPCLDGCVNID